LELLVYPSLSQWKYLKVAALSQEAFEFLEKQNAAPKARLQA
jgi:hypothetical protein